MASDFLHKVVLVCASALVLGSTGAAREEPAGAKGVSVYNVVRGRTAVLSGLPEGARVKKGERVCALDPSALKEQLAIRETLVAGAEAYLRGARMDREVAELAVAEYPEGVYRRELVAVEGEVVLAESARVRAEDQLQWSDRMLKKGYASVGENVADTLALRQANFALENARGRKHLLEKYTKVKAIKALEAAVEKAKAVELEKRAALEREQAARSGLMRQIEACQVLAPVDGRVRYLGTIEPGVVVRRGQRLFRVVPEDAPGEAK